MIQTFTSSRFSSNLQLSQPEKGSFTWLQPQRRHTRHTKILYRDKENKYLGFSCPKILDLAESFSCNGNKRSHGNLLVQTHGATSDGEFVLQPSDDHKVKLQSQTWMNWDAFYRFCRPYTVYGVVVAVCSASLLPLTSVRDLSPAVFVGMLQAMIPFILGNIYTSAINQLYDVEIDKINKPYLPLASGEFSMGQGKAIVLALGFTSLATGIMSQSLPLFIGVLLYFILGTAYSIKLPYLRWKTNPYLAAFCMVVLCGITMQPAAFYHIQQNVLGKPVVLTKTLGFVVIFFSLFAIVLAMFKDIPDVEGDRAAGSRTFSVRHGKEKVFSTGVGILLFAYGYAVVIGASSSLLIYKLVSVIGHCTLASILLLQAKSLNLDDNAATQSFYMFLWKLLYAEYVLIHFMR